MNRILTALLLALALLTPGPAIAASTPPPVPGEWRPSTVDGCWKSTLERQVERRTYRLSGHTFVEFRHTATVLRWCPASGYEVVVWRGAWGPGRR